jgi:PAS domain S-box-containing protein
MHQDTRKGIVQGTALILLGLTIVLLLLWQIDCRIIQPAFQNLEYRQAIDDAHRVQAGLENELMSLGSIANDWASWDDTYEFAENHNRRYIESNYLDPSLLSRVSKVDLLAIFDRQGSELLNGNFHPEIGNGVTIQSFSGESPPILSLLTPVLADETSLTGILQTDQGLLLLVARPIYDSQAQGPSRGVLIMGRFLSQSVLFAVARSVYVPFELLSRTDGKLTASEHALFNHLVTAVPDRNPEFRQGYLYQVYPDIEKKPALLLRTPLQGEIKALGRRTGNILSSTLGSIALGLLICLVVYRSRMKTSEEALRQEQVFSKAVIDSLPGIFFLFTYLELQLVIRNKAHESLLDKESGVGAGRHITDWFTPETKGAVMNFVEMVMEKGQNSLEASMLVQDGRLVPFIFTGSRFRSQDQFYFMGTGIDITERKRVEEELRESENRYCTLVDLAVDGILLGSHEGIITGANECMCTIVGLAREEFVGKHISALPFIRDDLETNPLRFDLLQKGETVVGERAIIRPDGLEITVEMRSKMMPDGTYQSIFRDITERKRIEVESHKLEARNLQLQKTESLNRLAGAIAHHFNNQLQVVLGNLELVMNSHNDKNAQLLSDTMQAARKAAKVSSLMLTYLGQTSSRFAPLDLSEVCRQTLPLLKAAAPKCVDFTVDLPSPGPIINANVNQIQQILTNLATNAWEATGENQATVTLAVKTQSRAEMNLSGCFPVNWQPQESVYACLEVADTGCGIPLSDIEKLFDPFFSRKFTGRGMGLAVVLGLAKSHGGAVTVESTTGKGSTFRVFFSLSAEGVPPRLEKAAQAAEIEMSGTVLLVEDEEMVRSMAEAMLRRLGFAVLSARDGVEALDIFRQHRDEIRLMLCDLTMPRMNGWETLTHLRRLAPGIPVILASGYSEIQVMGGKQPERPQAFLHKPYQREQLSDTIRQALAG